MSIGYSMEGATDRAFLHDIPNERERE